MEVGPFNGPARLQASHRRQPPGAQLGNTALAVFVKQRIGAYRQRHIVTIADLDAKKGGRRNSKDREGPPLQSDAAAKYAWVGAKLTLPESIADHADT